MPSEAERIEILKMVEAQQITPEDATRLLGALGETHRTTAVANPIVVGTAGAGRWFKLQVQEPGGQNVNVTLPLVAIPAIMRFAARWVPEEHRDALQVVTEAIQSDFRGEILRVEEPGGQRVCIWIE